MFGVSLRQEYCFYLCFGRFLYYLVRIVALSAGNHLANILSIRLSAHWQSATVPLVICNRTSILNASTAKWLFELSSLLCVTCPDCLLWLPFHRDVPWYMKPQSWTIQNRGFGQTYWIIFPIYLYHANDRTFGGCYSNSHILTKYPNDSINKKTIVFCRSAFLASTSR